MNACPSTRDGHPCQIGYPHPSRRHRWESKVTEGPYRHTLCITWPNHE